jgi:hypothetical protein
LVHFLFFWISCFIASYPFFALMHVARILHFIILANYTKRMNSVV